MTLMDLEKDFDLLYVYDGYCCNKTNLLDTLTGLCMQSPFTVCDRVLVMSSVFIPCRDPRGGEHLVPFIRQDHDPSAEDRRDR